MKNIVLLVLVIIGGRAFGQQGVYIHEDPRIEQQMKMLTTRTVVVQPAISYIYNIQLISTYDRNEANKTRANFRKYYPGEESFLSYKNPKYIIRVGKYTSELEAKEKLAELRKKFPSAFLLPPKMVQ